MRERTVEARLRTLVAQHGGWSIKLLPSVAGLPDRIVLLPHGRIFFVELKAPTGRLSAVQSVVHHRLASLGFSVAVLYSPYEVDRWVQSLDQEPPRTD